MDKKVRSLSLSDLRKIIREEADMLQGKTHPKDVSPEEMPWNEAEDVGRQDFVAQVDKPTPGVKAEARLRVLKLHADRLKTRLKETLKRIETYEGIIAEASRGRRPVRTPRRR